MPLRPSTPPAEDVTEDVAKDVADVAMESAWSARPGARTVVDTRVAELVIGSPLLRVLEDLVGFLRLLEFFLRGLVIRISIRMVFHRQPAISFFQLIVGRRFRHAQCFVVVRFCHACRLFVVLHLICG